MMAVRQGWRAALALASGAAMLATLGGCGAVWTYGEAMDLRRSTYVFHFDPPDDDAYKLPTPPPVYAAIFDERTYVPPNPVVLPPTKVSRSRTEAADTLTSTPPLITLEPPPPVQIDLSPAQESALRGRAARDMAAADSLLSLHARSNLSRAEISEQFRAAQGLLHQARAALDRRDYQGAANLAEKARVLAEQLMASQP